MQRLTARLLVVLSLVGAFAPAALALSAPPVHACCMRKPLHNHTSHQAQFSAVDCCHHNCCRPLAVSRWAQPRRTTVASGVEPSAAVIAETRPSRTAVHLDASRFLRGPPAC